MKIVDRQTFLRLPAGTVYAKYQPSVFEGLCIKGDSLENDWFYVSLSGDAIKANDSGEWGSLLDESEGTGKDLEMDFDIESRDGCFDGDQLFAVLTHDDLTSLISRLMKAWMSPASTTAAKP